MNIADQDVRLTILHTSDIHSRILPYDFAPLKPDRDLGLEPSAPPFGGVARLSAMIRRERARSDRVMHLDSGDCFQGAPIFNVNNGEAEFRWLSLIKADAVVVGNHEFDKGVRNFAYQAQTWANFPLLAANYLFESSKETYSTQLDQVVKPFTIVNLQGLKVAVIGMGNLSSMTSVGEGGNSLLVTPLEQNETVRSYVGFLRSSVDLVIVVSHLGLTEDQELINGYDAFYTRDQAKRFLCAAGVEPSVQNPCWKVLEELPPDVVRVFIPGVTGVDVIMGGHLHIVLSPPQVLKDQTGKEVVLSHSGAFSKYLGRLDLVVRNKQVIGHTYRALPVDAAWCADPRPNKAGDVADTAGYQAFLDSFPELRRRCLQEEDPATIRMLQPYILDLDYKLDLPRIFAYAPRDVNRRETTGGDSPLGDLTAASMAIRRRAEAQFALTNSLGIRDSLYAGPIKLEDMFNVFPFENLITTMYLSGDEVQQMFDFVTERSAGRGCQSQAQIAGASFVMDCAQALENDRRRACNTADECYAPGEDDNTREADRRKPWQCIRDQGSSAGRCWSNPAPIIKINGTPIVANASYKVAVNDFISRGGSGFKVLKRNTTRVDTGISLRDGLIDHLRTFCTCNQLEAGSTSRCIDGGALAREWCASVRPALDQSKTPEERNKALGLIRLTAGDPNHPDDVYAAGACTCLDARTSFENKDYGNVSDDGYVIRGLCAHVTRAEYTFCKPESGALLNTPVVVYDSDGRIERRVK